MKVETWMPLRTYSTLNQREHWGARARRAKQEREAAYLCVPRASLEFPLIVRLTRIAPRALDGHDNLRSSFKAIVDGISQRLGINDRDPCVTWEYAQERGKPREYAVRIEFSEAA